MKSEYQKSIERIEANDRAFFLGNLLVSTAAILLAIFIMDKLF